MRLKPLVLSALSLSLLAAPPALAQSGKIVIMVGGMEKIIYLPAKLAEVLGYYKAEGLNVELQNEPAGVDADFAQLTAAQALARLQSRPDALFVSQETVNDYNLSLGDPIRLRLQSARDHQYHTVPFTFVGVVREFPTAPKDSFLVANAAYIAAHTGSDAREVVLLRTDGSPQALAARAAALVADLPGAQVTPVGAVRQAIASSLTAVNVTGLARLELGFALLLLVGATGLVLALGLAERRRQLTVLTALGARPDQVGAFLNAEVAVVAGLGTLAGGLIGLVVAQALVKILQGVFDPPPDVLVWPWAYLAALLLAALLSVLLTVQLARLASSQRVAEVLRAG